MAVTREFPALAAKPLIEGYCQEFVALAAVFQQTLEQIETRGLDIGPCLDALTTTSDNMSGLEGAIRAVIARQAAKAQRRSSTRRRRRTVAAAAAAPEPKLAPPPAARCPATAATEPTTSPCDATQTIRGDTQMISLAAVMQFVSRVRKSGTLHVDVGREHVTFEFVNGVIEGSTSNQSVAGERIGEILLERFPAHRERLLEALARFAKRGSVRRLGAELVRAGVATEAQVVDALEQQVNARFRRIVDAPQATYAFDEGERVPSDGRIRIRPFDLEHAGRFRGR